MSWKEDSARRNTARKLTGSAWALVPLTCLLVLLSAGVQQAKSAAGGSSAQAEGYIGSQACAQCHAETYRQFSQTSMGRSMSPVTPAFLKNTPSSYSNEKLHRRFEVYSKDGALLQSESGVAGDGGESFHAAERIDWIIGAGINGFGGIVKKDDFLFQAPLSFYAKPSSWGPSPGYEFTDLGFNRPILPGCIFCHSGRPNSIAGTSGKFESELVCLLGHGLDTAELAKGPERLSQLLPRHP